MMNWTFLASRWLSERIELGVEGVYCAMPDTHYAPSQEKTYQWPMLSVFGYKCSQTTNNHSWWVASTGRPTDLCTSSTARWLTTWSHLPTEQRISPIISSAIFYIDIKSDKGERLRECASDHGYKQWISEPTRSTATSSTTIDLIFAPESTNIVEAGVAHVGITDHDMIYCVTKYKIHNPRLSKSRPGVGRIWRTGRFRRIVHISPSHRCSLPLQ